MTIWSPEWRIKIDGTNYTSITLVGLTISSGRNNINSQAQAGYCQVELINSNNSNFPIDVASDITIEVKKSNGSYLPIFGGTISDVSIGVRSSGSTTFTTSYNIIALGALFKLNKAVWTTSLAQDKDGTQIYTILKDLLLNQWNEVPAAEQWSTYNATETWADAQNIGLGEIDQPGQYTMEQRSAGSIDFYSIITQIANSGLGYIYEDANGNIGYADSAHRTTYLAVNGYRDLSANDALALGIRATKRQGNIVNSYVLNYGNNFGSQVTSLNQSSIDSYGRYQITENSYVHSNTDAQAIADRYIQLRAYPRAQFESITFALQNPELDDGDRDALLAIFMGMPIRITDLPALISDGQFEGYVEGWTFTASVSGLSLRLVASPTEFSAVAQNWNQVNGSEAWNTLSPTLKWENAIGVIS
jgi:hypothetical protein